MTAGEPIEATVKKGNLLRLVHHRTVLADCLDCGRTFSATGQATSHARAKRHTIHVDYSTAFTYTPRERVNQA